MEKIVEFIINGMPWYSGQEEEIKKIIRLHIEYGTFDYEEDEKGIVYCLRYNILPSGKVADVLDLCTREKDKSSLIKYIILKNVRRWPSLEVIRFVRRKYSGRQRIIRISDIFKKEIKWAADQK